MDSTPNPNLSLKSKLPIKRKISDPNLEHLWTGDGEDNGGEGRPALYKFHRIWTEPDEIRFLQCLLDSTDLSFPRDLHLFYSRFKTTSPSHAYTKSQLYEKLRRLRRKFRATSLRLARGHVALSPHDGALFDLSKRLWHPDFSSVSPFSARGGGNNNNRSSGKQKNDNKKSNLVGVRVSFSPTLDIVNRANVSNRVGDDKDDEDFEEDHFVDGVSVESMDGFDSGIDNVQLSEVNVELDDDDVEERELAMPNGGGGGGGGFGGGGCGGGFGGGIGEVVAKTVMNVFDQSLDEVRTLLIGDLGSDGAVVHGLEKRWREQRVAELDVLGRRLRLVLEHSIRKQ